MTACIVIVAGLALAGWFTVRCLRWVIRVFQDWGRSHE